MPFFSSHRDPPPEPVYEAEPTPKKHGLFHRRGPAAVPAPESETDPATHPRTGTGLFSRRDRSPTPTHRTSRSLSPRSTADAASSSSGRRRNGGLLRRAMGGGGRDDDDDADPSILQARERVMDAEAAEAQADRALDEARLRVREAREHAEGVEVEAEEEARRAHLKQRHVREVMKRGKGLGREFSLSLSLSQSLQFVLVDLALTYTQATEYRTHVAYEQGKDKFKRDSRSLDTCLRECEVALYQSAVLLHSTAIATCLDLLHVKDSRLIIAGPHLSIPPQHNHLGKPRQCGRGNAKRSTLCHGNNFKPTKWKREARTKFLKPLAARYTWTIM